MSSAPAEAPSPTDTQTHPPHVIDVDEAAFETAVLEESSRRPVVVDFWAGWCQPCRILAPVLEKLATAGGGKWLLAKVDVEEAPGLASKFGVRGIPAVKAFRDGAVVDQFEGAMPEAYLARWLSAIVPTPADDAVTRAAAVERTDPAAAMRILEEALAAEPDHAGALVALARLLARRGTVPDLARVADLLRRVPVHSPRQSAAESVQQIVELHRMAAESSAGTAAAADPAAGLKSADAETRFAAACITAARGGFDDGVGALLDLMREDPGTWTDRARPAIVAAFGTPGVTEEAVDRRRAELASLLY